MLKTKKTCTVCQCIKLNDVVLEKIYASSAYTPGGISLKELQKSYSDKFSYTALTNHCKKHQFLSDDDYTKRHLSDIAKQAEKRILKQKIESKDVWDKVINQGMEKLEKGEISLKTADLLKAAKDQSDYDFKKKDQEMAFLEMVYFFASGENDKQLNQPYEREILSAKQHPNLIEGETLPDLHPTEGTPEPIGDGPDRSGAVYYPPAWDAAA